MESMFPGRRGWVVKLLFTLMGIAALAGMATPSMAGVVTSTADSGPGTLRQELQDANSDGVPTLITFDPGVFPAVISLNSRLPALRGEGDTIDTAGLTVIINGTAVPDDANAHAIGIRVMAGDATVHGLTIRNFSHAGIYVGPSRTGANEVIDNVTVSENRLVRNFDGIRISGNNGPYNFVEATILDNVLVNNLNDGIIVEGSRSDSDGNNTLQIRIEGNRVVGSQGVATGGTLTGDGIRVLGGRGNGSDNEVYAVIMNNRTVGNIDDGIVVAGAGGNAASNNYIETTIQNNIVRNNGDQSSINGNGIVIRGGSRGGATSPGNDNTLRFEVTGNRSVVNKDSGIVISGGLGTGNRVEGLVLSNRARGNGLDGLRVTASMGTRNVLANIWVEQNRLVGNMRDGININGGGGTLSLVQGISIINNRAARNSRFGLLITPGSGTGNSVTVDGITGNRTIANLLHGLFVNIGVNGDGSTPIASNRSNLNGQDGIAVDSTGYVLHHNRAMNNVGNGIYAVGNTDGGNNIAVGNAACNTPGCF